ncbi:MAG: hypothetical protein ABEJ30_02750 [Halorientalis sp.]
MRGVLVYGSLLDPAALAATLSAATAADAVPVRVAGYRRTFGMASRYREGEDGETAILTAEPDPEAWLNAVLVPDVPDEEFAVYRQREQRYDLVDVPAESVTAYHEPDAPTVAGQDERLLAVSERGLEDPEPIPYYAADCLAGARAWDEEFLADFLVTTSRT